MIDQTVQIKYIGTAQRWPELSITGRQSVWMPGQIESRSKAEAASLLATGLFSSPPVPALAETSPGGVVRKSNGLAVGELAVGSVIYAQRQHAGYLPANGAVYSRATYPALRATIGTVPDGAATWTARTSAENNNWRSVCRSPELSLFCAVANTGTGNRVMTSPDGITWTPRTSAADNGWNSVCWSPELSLFCAVAISGTGNRVMTNAPAATYNPRTHFKLPVLPNATSGEARAFIYAGA